MPPEAFASMTIPATGPTIGIFTSPSLPSAGFASSPASATATATATAAGASIGTTVTVTVAVTARRIGRGAPATTTTSIIPLALFTPTFPVVLLLLLFVPLRRVQPSLLFRPSTVAITLLIFVLHSPSASIMVVVLLFFSGQIPHQ